MAKKAAKAKKTKKTTKKAPKKKAPAKTKAKAKAKPKPVEAKKKKPAKKQAKRKSRSKRDAANVPMRLFWGVFNHAMKPVAKYAFNQRKAAEKRAKELTVDGKPPHFVAKIKEPIEEA